MKEALIEKNLRILVIDDNHAIHDDFRKILNRPAPAESALAEAEAVLFNAAAAPAGLPQYELDSAYQGREGLARVEQALKEGRPYAMAFLDVRMPPGWDGVETATRLWAVCPDLQIVVCTAYSDYSWDEMAMKLESSDRLLILKKPFDSVEVLQLASALTAKWGLHQQAKLKVEELELAVQARTSALREANEKLQNEILDHRRAAEALRQSEERYQLLFCKNPLPMWVFDQESLAFLAVNETAVRDYGWEADEFLAMDLKDLRPASEAPAWLDELSSPGDAAAYSVVTRHQKKDGTVIDVEAISCPIIFDGRKARLVLANNITERKAAEGRIHEQAALLDLAQDAIFARDMKGRIQFWNKGAENLYGWPPAEAVGKTLDELFPGQTSAAMLTAELSLLERGEWQGELRKHTRKGVETVVDSRWTLLRDSAGKPRSVLVINTDVTEKKKIEAQFLRAQRMEGIGTLATGMAHDLNNILSPILMTAGLLRWEKSVEEREAGIARIESSVQRGAEIIKQVLTFGRGVSGERVPVNTQRLVEEVSKIFAEIFPRNIDINLAVEDGLWPIMGDKTQIHQILMNLCINSRDAMPKGGKLSLRGENFMVDEAFASRHTPLRAGPYVKLQVVDTGEGISPGNRDKIFDPFFTTKELGKGTGLGLSTVLGIVKSHHGLVTVESEIDLGTTFTVLLPASPVAPKKLPAASSGDLFGGRGETILLVDDEPNILALTRRALEQYGYTIFTANNGQEAFSLLSRSGRPFDAVLTDIMMPGMDGVALVRALRAINPRVKIIVSSGLGGDLSEGSRVKELEALGVKMFLTKPYSTEKLLSALEDLLAEGRSSNDLKRDRSRELIHV